MTTVRAPASALRSAEARPRAVQATAILRASAIALVILAAALLAMLAPPVLHAALDASGSAAILGVPPSEAHRLSDLTVRELLLGPGTFLFVGPDGRPFFDPSEAGHMRDVRVVLYGFLGLAALAAVGLVMSVRSAGDRLAAWRSIGRGGLALVIGLLVGGVLGLLAFDAAFELFHRLLFPGGNYAFDPARQRLVQLYPTPFWQIVAAGLGALAASMGAAVWWVARRRTPGERG